MAKRAVLTHFLTLAVGVIIGIIISNPEKIRERLKKVAVDFDEFPEEDYYDDDFEEDFEELVQDFEKSEGELSI